MAETTTDIDAWFVDLYDEHRHLVFSVALRLCGRWSDAEDIASEAFLRAFRAASRYDARRRAELAARPWLASIVRNVWKNRARTASRKPPPDNLGDTVEVTDPGQDVAAAAEIAETSRELAELLVQLPEKQRECVVLRHVAELSIGEISVALDLPEGTIKSHISRGLKRLRELTEGAVQ